MLIELFCIFLNWQLPIFTSSFQFSIAKSVEIEWNAVNNPFRVYNLQICYFVYTQPYPHLSALDFCNSPVWNMEFDELDFYSISNLNFTGIKIQFKLRKQNPVSQTRYFKLENCKNQLQLDRGLASLANTLKMSANLINTQTSHN